MTTPEHKRLGDLLVERGSLEPGRLQRALRLQPKSGDRLGSILVKLGMAAERDVARALASQLDLPFTELEAYPHAAVLDNEVSPRFLRESRIAPLLIDGEDLVVSMTDPGDRFALDALEMATGRRVVPQVGASGDIEAALVRQYLESEQAAGVSEGRGQGAGADLDEIQHLRDLASEAPVIRLVNYLMVRALELRASDIHIEPFENRLKVRYRVDGVLREVDAPPAGLTAAVISRVKIMANLDIAERRLPQDGRITLAVEGKDVDMRVSTVPAVYGESVVLRILDREAVPLDFRALGFAEDVLPRFLDVLDLPHGIVLVTGPTGSGKTTTLYAALERLNTPERKILTVEDPVEYQLDGVNQIQVKPGIGLTFASALRAFLRQDPDVIMVGEMRDLETARIAVQAALTGHKVFSTLHTNDAAGSIIRLLDMGMEDYLVTSTVNGVVAQRLVRRLCSRCREPYQALPELADELRLSAVGLAPDTTFYKARGCHTCEGTGYQGRSAILELMVMNDDLRQAILKRSDGTTLQRMAVAGGMRTMYADGIRKAAQGETSVEEVMRVTKED